MADQEKMGLALQRLAKEDPSFRLSSDPESGQDHHRRHGRAAPGDHRRSHEARVQGRRRTSASRWSPTAKPFAPRSNRKASSCASPAVAASTATSWITLEPNDAGKGFEFVNGIVGGSVPKGIHPGGREGHQGSDRQRRAGRLPGRGREGDAVRRLVSRRRSRTKWRSRSRAPWRSRTPCPRPSRCILEPIMKVEVVTPEDYYGDIVGDLNRPSRPDRRHGRFHLRQGRHGRSAAGR